MTVRLLSYNIRYGGVGREAALARVVGETAPDVVVFQEATEPRVVERIAREAGLEWWAARQGNSVGFASRLEVERFEWYRPPGTRRAFLEVALAGSDLRVYGIHLSAVHSNWTERRRVRELRATLAAIAGHRDGFHVLAGDFNTLAPGELLEVRRLPMRLRPLVWLSGGKIRWQTIQIMLDGGYVDGYRRLNPDEKGFTFPTWDPHIRLDYVFVPERHAERLTSCAVVGAADGASDHFPLLAHLETE